MKYLIAISAVFSLALASLGFPDPTPTQAAAGGEGRAPSEPSSNIDDKSLSVEQYVEAGVPSPDHDWTAADLGRAVKALQKLFDENPETLPRFSSPKSGAMFARMVSPDNLKICTNTKLSKEARAISSSQLLTSSAEMLLLYSKAQSRKKVSSRELTELLSYELNIAASLASAMSEIIPTISKDDPKYEARMAGIQKMQSGSANIVGGTLDALSDTATLTPTDRDVLTSHLETSLPSLMRLLTPNTRSELTQRLKTLSKDDSLIDVRPKLAAMLEALAKQQSSQEK